MRTVTNVLNHSYFLNIRLLHKVPNIFVVCIWGISKKKNTAYSFYVIRKIRSRIEQASNFNTTVYWSNVTCTSPYCTEWRFGFLRVNSIRHLESFEMWKFRRMLKISSTERTHINNNKNPKILLSGTQL